MQFTHEHREMQKTLRRFIDDHINPHVDEWEAAEMFPAHEVFRELGRLGLLGLTKPEAYGGAGLDYSYSVAMAETLGHIHCGGVPMAIGVQTVEKRELSRFSMVFSCAGCWSCLSHSLSTRLISSLKVPIISILLT